MSMQVFTKGDTALMTVTLEEKRTVPNPYYLMRFRNMTTEEEVKFVVNSTADLSQYQYRYNQFSIVVNDYFTGKPDGLWWYYIYEQSSDTNTDPALATNLLEHGYMKLKPATAYTVTEAATDNTYKVYAGS